MLAFLSLGTEEGIVWETSLEAALAQARIRNVPLVLLMTQDDDRETDATLQLYRSRKFQDFASRVVFVAAHKGWGHEASTKVIEGREVTICGLYNVPCVEHMKAYEAAVKKYISKEFWFPVQIFLFPDGRESFRFQKAQDGKLVLGEIERALKAAGPGVLRPEYERILSEVEKAKLEAKDGEAEEGRKRIRGLVRKNHPEEMKKFLEAQAAKL